MKYCENDLFHLVWVERVLGAVHLGAGDEVQRLPVRADVLDLADGLGGGGHVVGDVLLLGPGHQGRFAAPALEPRGRVILRLTNHSLPGHSAD